jgi:hypothetical protein
MKLVMVDSMDQVLAAALRRKPRPLKASPAKPVARNDSESGARSGTKTPLFPPQQPPAVA